MTLPILFEEEKVSCCSIDNGGSPPHRLRRLAIHPDGDSLLLWGVILTDICVCIHANRIAVEH